VDGYGTYIQWFGNTALYLTYAKAHLINSIWGMILPSMISPVGIYLMKVYTDISVPRELIDAARIDGGGEARIFFRVALPLMVPGLMTVLLISVVAVWNNYFLPLLISGSGSRWAGPSSASPRCS
jgi:multiple sugar transport system permease protein